MEWDCPECSETNNADVLKCSMCGLLKDLEPTPPKKDLESIPPQNYPEPTHPQKYPEPTPPQKDPEPTTL